MNCLAPQNTAWFIAIVCAVGGGAWCWFEIRRPNHRQRTWRVLAALIAAAALAALGLRPAWPGEAGAPPTPEDAALWTPSLAAETRTAVPRDVTANRVFALPGTAAKPNDALTIPDVAFVRREYPQVKSLHIFGDGLNDFEADVMRGLRVIFHPSSTQPPAPGIAVVNAPREVTFGEPFVVQGRVSGISPDAPVNLSLTAPDGTRRAVALSPGEGGTATFSIPAAPAAAIGRYRWRLELRAGEAGRVLAAGQVGVSVVPPIMPRVLILENSPRFDTARLRRWLGDRGAKLTVRTQLSRDRYRITSANGAREAVEVADDTTLDAFDLVVADARTIAELDEPQRAALRAAIGERGLGLLAVADETTFESTTYTTGLASADEFLSPWKLVGEAGSNEAEERVARLHWPQADFFQHDPLPVPPFEIGRRGGQRPLVRDGQGRALVVAAGRGRGQIALTLVRETWRWTQADDAGAFASLWSFLFSELAKPDLEQAGHWSVANNDGAPLFVNQPVELRWSGPPERAPMPGQVISEETSEPARLALAQDSREASRWSATYWPQRVGWHRVSSPNGGRSLDFFVAESATWPQLAAARRQVATQKIAAFSGRNVDPPVAEISGTALVEPLRGWFFAVLFSCLTYLWLESRTLRRGAAL